MTQLFHNSSGQNAIILCGQLPDDSHVLELQHLVDATQANLAVAVLQPDILASAHQGTVAEALALVSHDMPAVTTVALLQHHSTAGSSFEDQSVLSTADAAAQFKSAGEDQPAGSVHQDHSVQSMVQLVTKAAQQAMDSTEAVSVSEPLMDAGLDSSTSVQLVSLLEEATGLELPGTLAFDYPSVAEIADHLASLLQPSIPVPSQPAVVPEVPPQQTLSTAVAPCHHEEACMRPSRQTEVSVGTKLSLAQLTDVVIMTARDALGLTAESGQLQDSLSPTTPLMDAGLDSSLAIQFTSQLEATLHVDLPGTLVFDYPSVDDIVTFLAASLCSHDLQVNTPDAADDSCYASAQPTISDAAAFETVATAVNIAEVLRSIVMDHIAEITGNSDTDVSMPLMDAGVTSATAVELTSALEETLSCELPGTLIFDYPTVASLVTYLTSCNITLPAHATEADTTLPAATTQQQTSAVSPPSQPVGAAAVINNEAATSHVPRALAAGPAENSPQAVALVATAHRVPGGSLASPGAAIMASDRVSAVPLDRWHIGETAPGNAAELNQQFGAFLSGADEFDPAAFHLSAAEATMMDPQQRLLLECFSEAWTSHQSNPNPQSQSTSPANTTAAAMHSSNSSGSSISNKQNFGVYVGVSQLEYARITYETGINLNAYYATGAHLSVTAGRIAYTFGLKGPAMAVDTACSSSLVTTHLAARALREGAIGGAASMGVNLTLVHSWTRACLRAGMLSEDGRYNTAADLITCNALQGVKLFPCC